MKSNRKQNRRLERFVLLLLIGLAGPLLSWSQGTINAILPAGPYTSGQQIKIVGSTTTFDFNNTNCDSLVFVKQPSGPSFRFRASQPSTTRDYSGADVAIADTIYWTIPCSWPTGTYLVYNYDDEDCDNYGGFGCLPSCVLCGACGWSAGFGPITINNACSPGCSPPVLAYGTGTYCLGATNPTPTNAMGSGTFLDLTSGGNPLTNAVFNATTGQLGLHSGWAGTTHQIEFTGTAGCKDTTTVRLKPLYAPTVTYSAPSYCKILPGIPPPTVSIPGLGGTFAVSPALTGFNTTNGSVAFSGSEFGTFNVTYTAPADSCVVPYSTQFTIIDVEFATYNYDTVYCAGDGAGGYPLSITTLPAGGGMFQEASTTNGLVIDPNTGKIDLLSSLGGIHHIEYVPTNIGCSVIVRDTVNIRPPLSSLFTVPPAVCFESGLVACTFSPFTSGTFFSPTGAIYFDDANLGIINTDSCTVGGPHLIYRTNGDLACPDTTQGHIAIQLRSTAVLNYDSTVFCQSAINPLPIFVSGAAGGTFSISPAGGAIVPTTGEILLNNCIANTYTVSYITGGTTCPDTTLLSVKVDSVPNPSFVLPQDSFCANTGVVILTGVPVSGGTDTWNMYLNNGTPIAGAVSGASFDTDTIPAGGPYMMVRTSTLAGCRDSAIQYLSIMAEEDASFVFVPDTFCRADQDPIPVLLGNSGGTFANASGAVLAWANQSIGRVSLDPPTASGAHLISYQTGGFCPDSDTTSLFIKDALNPEFSYPTLNYCQGVLDTVVATYDTTIFTPGTFIFSMTPSDPGLNTSNGTLIMNSIPADSYVVVMFLTITQGACVDSFARTVIVHQPDADSTASLNFRGNNNYCVTEDTVQAQLVSIDQDGRYFSTPPTLAWQDRDTGLVDINASPPGGYWIYFVKNNSCRDTLSDSIHIGAPNDPVITYFGGPDSLASTEFCKSDVANPFPTLVPQVSGVFWSTSLLTGDTLIFVDDSTGVVDLNATTDGYFDVFFREISGCAGQGSVRLTINPGPVPDLVLLPGIEICDGTPDTLYPSSGSRFEIWLNTNQISVDTMVVIDSLADGDMLTLTVTDRFGCKGTSVDTMTVYPVPDGSLAAPVGTITGNDPISFTMTTSADETYFYWTASTAGAVELDYLQDSTTIPIDSGLTTTLGVGSQLLSDFDPGVAIFLVTPRAKICTGAVDTVTFLINPENVDLFIPEVFTPDGNGSNDTWQLQWRTNITPEDFEIFVYNRSGGEVAYFNKLTSDWNGESVPDGVYWYLIRSKAGTVGYEGAVTIRRN